MTLCIRSFKGIHYNGHLVPNSTFKGTGPAQPYLDYAMIGLINNAPNDFVQKIRNEVKGLKLNFFGDISNFINLEKLDMSYNGASNLFHT